MFINKQMKVSIVIPFYNMQEFILDCMNSVENQKYREIEVVCVNDGSTDGSRKILEEFISSSKLEIKLINQDNLGAPNARNAALKYCKGDYIQFLDADDILLPMKIDNQIKLAHQNNFPDLIVGSYKSIDLESNLLSKNTYNPSVNYNLWENLMNTNLGNTCSNLFKHDMFKNKIKWDETLKSSQEYNLIFSLLKNKISVIFDSQINTLIRIRAHGSISKSNIVGKWERYVDLRVRIINYLSVNEPEILNDQLMQVFFSKIRILYPYNPKLAKSYYKEFFSCDFIPEMSSNNSRLYVFLFKTFGFDNTERIKSFTKKLNFK